MGSKAACVRQVVCSRVSIAAFFQHKCRAVWYTIYPDALSTRATGQRKHQVAQEVHWQPRQSSQLRQRMTSMVFASFASSSDLDMSSSAGAPAVCECTQFQ